jgi:hypothetical protein
LFSEKEASVMDHRPSSGMVEATRLTRAGRLKEATALLQRLLGGKAPPDVKDAIAHDAKIAALHVPPRGVNFQ